MPCRGARRPFAPRPLRHNWGCFRAPGSRSRHGISNHGFPGRSGPRSTHPQTGGDSPPSGGGCSSGGASCRGWVGFLGVCWGGFLTVSVHGPSSWLAVNRRPRKASHTPVLGRSTRPLYTGWRPDIPCRRSVGALRAPGLEGPVPDTCADGRRTRAEAPARSTLDQTPRVAPRRAWGT